MFEKWLCDRANFYKTKIIKNNLSQEEKTLVLVQENIACRIWKKQVKKVADKYSKEAFIEVIKLFTKAKFNELNRWDIIEINNKKYLVYDKIEAKNMNKLHHIIYLITEEKWQI